MNKTKNAIEIDMPTGYDLASHNARMTTLAVLRRRVEKTRRALLLHNADPDAAMVELASVEAQLNTL